jgi:hypothetical protein
VTSILSYLEGGQHIGCEICVRLCKLEGEEIGEGRARLS